MLVMRAFVIYVNTLIHIRLTNLHVNELFRSQISANDMFISPKSVFNYRLTYVIRSKCVHNSHLNPVSTWQTNSYQGAILVKNLES